MKVEDRTPIPASGPAKAARPTREIQGLKGKEEVQDRLDLSVGVSAVQKAIAEATPTRHIRPEAVARAQALMENGDLGKDLGRLADRMIDSLVEDGKA